MTNIQRYHPDTSITLASALGQRQNRKLSKTIAQIEDRTIARLANMGGEVAVVKEKMRAVDKVAMTAMSGHAMLVQYGAALAGGDPMTAMDLAAFIAQARIGKMQKLSDLIDDLDGV